VCLSVSVSVRVLVTGTEEPLNATTLPVTGSGSSAGPVADW